MEMLDMVDMTFVDKFNAIGGAFILIATYIFGQHWIIFLAFIVLNVLDYITGVAKSRIKKTESSSEGLHGILKKFMYWCIIAVAFLMCPLFNELGAAMGTDISMFTPAIGYLTLAMLVVNEFRSIMENLVECGVQVPTLLIRGLAVFEKLALAESDRYFDGKLEVDRKADDHYQVKIDTPLEELEKKDSVTLKIKTVNEEDDDT